MSHTQTFNIKTILDDIKRLNYLIRLVKRKEIDVTYYVCNNHLGDITFFCSLAKTAQSTYNKRIIIVVNERYRSIPEMFGLNFLVADLPEFEYINQSLYSFYLTLRTLFSKSKILFQNPGVHIYFKFPRKKILSDLYMTSTISLGLRVKLHLSCIDDNFSTVPASASNEFSELGLVANRTVIISPDSYTMDKIERQFFINLYESLRRKDYIPIFNSNDKFWIENNFKNFFPDPKKLVFFAKLSGYSISARSGISDLLSLVPGVHNIIIYNENVSNAYVFGKSNDSICTDISEYFYQPTDLNELVENIIDSMTPREGELPACPNI